VKTLFMMATEAPQVLVTDEVVLQQMTQNFLDANIERLCGQKCLELKAQNKVKDFAEYNFDPKLLLSQICTIYVVLMREGTEAKGKTLQFIAQDSRYYNPQTFAKAARILKRDRMLSGDLIVGFNDFIKELQVRGEAQAAADEVDIPDEFLDPILCEIMSDPVMLPDSKNVMDRKSIVRIIMSDDHDPFTRSPLKMEDLIPQVELKAQIVAFAKANSIPLE